MNDTEFKALLEQVTTADAGQFEDLCWHMAKIAAKVGQEANDNAWVHAANTLHTARFCVSQRAGE